ncbi:MAG: MerR family transcriptional regulator, partial [Hylemonella sp.]
AVHRRQIEDQMADLQATLDEIKAHEKEARALLAKLGEGEASGREKAA